MSKANVAMTAIESIDVNPHRKIDRYPINEDLIAQLIRSYEVNGIWEGVIGRQAGNRVEIAFGHHRLEAAKRYGAKEIPIIKRDLSDEEMLRMMGWENLPDYKKHFLALLETWEAGVEFHAKQGNRVKITDIARSLGWMRKVGKDANEEAKACAGVLDLIESGDYKREDFSGLTVWRVRAMIKKAKQEEKRSQKMEEKGLIESAEERIKEVTSEIKRDADIYRKIVDSDIVIIGVAEPAEPKPKEPPKIGKFLASLITLLSDLAVEDKLRNEIDAVLEALQDPEIIIQKLDRANLGLLQESLIQASQRLADYGSEVEKAINVLDGRAIEYKQVV